MFALFQHARYNASVSYNASIKELFEREFKRWKVYENNLFSILRISWSKVERWRHFPCLWTVWETCLISIIFVNSIHIIKKILISGTNFIKGEVTRTYLLSFLILSLQFRNLYFASHDYYTEWKRYLWPNW